MWRYPFANRTWLMSRSASFLRQLYPVDGQMKEKSPNFCPLHLTFRRQPCCRRFCNIFIPQVVSWSRRWVHIGGVHQEWYHRFWTFFWWEPSVIRIKGVPSGASCDKMEASFARIDEHCGELWGGMAGHFAVGCLLAKQNWRTCIVSWRGYGWGRKRLQIALQLFFQTGMPVSEERGQEDDAFLQYVFNWWKWILINVFGITPSASSISASVFGFRPVLMMLCFLLHDPYCSLDNKVAWLVRSFHMAVFLDFQYECVLRQIDSDKPSITIPFSTYLSYTLFI